MTLLRALDKQLSLFWKIQLANSLLIVLSVGASTVVVHGWRQLDSSTVAVALVAVGLGVMSNSLILVLALRPLSRVVTVMRHVKAGHTDDRCPQNDGDPWTRVLGENLNQMLDELELSRRDVAEAAMEAELAERQRLARELHDDTAQRLARLMMDLNTLRDRQASTALIAQARQTLESVREVLNDLHPAVLDDLGFFAAIRSLAAQKLPGLTTHLDLVGPEPPLKVAFPLYRICQEAFVNIVRHAQASEVWVRWSAEPGAYHLTIEDNGIGIPEGRRPQSGHYGLRTMQERIFALGGQADISRTPSGTSLVFRVPKEEIA